MPKLVKPSERLARALTQPEVRILSELATGGGRSRSTIEERAGGSAALRSLLADGMVQAHEVEIEDGVRERLWVITDEGKRRLGDSARVGDVQADVDGIEVNAVAPWFGSARRQAEQIGEATRGCSWVGVPFAGSMCEIPAILSAGANAISLNDLHRHLINMARVMADPILGASMQRRLRRQPFAIEVLRDAQKRASERPPANGLLDLESACDYFICAWMGRSAEAGREKEFRAGLAIRYGAGGGNSVLRFANAVGGIRAWRKILARCSFSCEDAIRFIKRANDRTDGCLYCDPDWPDAGAGYRHRIGNSGQQRLMEALSKKQKMRIVLRMGEHPLTRKLYPEKDGWKWLEIHGRNQGNNESTEWLIVKRGRDA